MGPCATGSEGSLGQTQWSNSASRSGSRDPERALASVSCLALAGGGCVRLLSVRCGRRLGVEFCDKFLAGRREVPCSSQSPRFCIVPGRSFVAMKSPAGESCQRDLRFGQRFYFSAAETFTRTCSLNGRASDRRVRRSQKHRARSASSSVQCVDVCPSAVGIQARVSRSRAAAS